MSLLHPSLPFQSLKVRQVLRVPHPPRSRRKGRLSPGMTKNSLRSSGLQVALPMMDRCVTRAALRPRDVAHCAPRGLNARVFPIRNGCAANSREGCVRGSPKKPSIAWWRKAANKPYAILIWPINADSPPFRMDVSNPRRNRRVRHSSSNAVVVCKCVIAKRFFPR